MRPRDATKEQAILAAALSEAARVGLVGLSIDVVAKRAGVGTGTVYVYFKSKEVLIEALYARVKREFGALLLPDEQLPVRVGVEQACRNFLDYCCEHQDEIAFLDQIELSPFSSEKVRAETAAAMRPLMALLERGKKELIVKRLDSDLLIAFLAAALRGLARSLPTARGARREQRMSEIVALCWDAIAA